MKVLFLAQAFPPANLPASSRNWNVARALSECGCHVNAVVLRADAWRRIDFATVTEMPPALRRIDVPSRCSFLEPWHLRTSDHPVARVLGGVARRTSRLLGIDPSIGWRIEAERATSRFTGDDVDVVLATGSPFSSFAVARRLARRLGKPFVVDYRDLWNHNPHNRGGRHRGLERRILRDAAAVIAISPSVLGILDRQYAIGSKGHLVTNGFDEEEMASIAPVEFDHFAVVYAGQFYPPKSVPDPVLTALRSVRIQHWKFHYAGPHAELVREAALRLGVGDRVVCHGSVSRRASLGLTKGAHLAVVITSIESTADPAVRGILTSKIFDVLGLERPLLVIAPRESDVEAIVAGRSHTACLPADDQAAIVRFIESLAAGRADASPVKQYSWRRRGGVLREILEDAVRQHGRALRP